MNSGAKPLDQQTKVLFVCLGNICRSPAAEGVMKHLIEQKGGGSQLLVDSAGTSGYHDGKPADKRMVQAASKRGIRIDSIARSLLEEDLHSFDLVVPMDRDNLRAIDNLGSVFPGRVALFSEFLDESWPTDVPDPYYGGDEGFEYVLDMLMAGCPAILEHLESVEANKKHRR